MYLRPKTLGDACKAMANQPARILAGGTDIFPALVDRPSPIPIVDLSDLAELKGVTLRDDEIRIGARTTWAGIARAELPPAFLGLKAAAREVGSIQIQNVATIGGNLCNASPAADGVPPLLVLDAQVELDSVAGTRRLPLADFLRGNRVTAREPDEILTAIVVRRDNAAGRSSFEKLGSRRYLVISVAMVAARIATGPDGRVAAAAIAVGSCSAVAKRLPALEADLVGRAADAGLADIVRPIHVDALAPIDDVRGSALYRLDAALTLVRRALASCVGVA